MSYKKGNYHSFDGDQIGRKLELLILEDRADEIVSFAREVNAAVSKLRTSLEMMGCTVLFASGDSVLAYSESPIDIDSVPRRFGTVTFSGGSGSSPKEALIALERAKLSGKGRLVCYREDY